MLTAHLRVLSGSLRNAQLLLKTPCMTIVSPNCDVSNVSSHANLLVVFLPALQAIFFLPTVTVRSAQWTVFKSTTKKKKRMSGIHRIGYLVVFVEVFSFQLDSIFLVPFCRLRIAALSVTFDSLNSSTINTYVSKLSLCLVCLPPFELFFIFLQTSTHAPGFSLQHSSGFLFLLISRLTSFQHLRHQWTVSRQPYIQV